MGGGGKKQARESDGKMGTKEKPLTLLSSKSSSDNDSNTSVEVAMKKSRR